MSSVHSRTDVRIYIKQISTLVSAGYKVSFIVCDGLGNDVSNKNILIIDVGKRPKSRILRFIFTSYRIYKTSAIIDSRVYHFHDPELIPVGLLLKLKCKKVVYDVHEDVSKQILSKDWIPLFLRLFVSCIYKKLEKIFLNYFDAVITATPYIKNNLIKYNVNTVDINNYPIINEVGLCCNYQKRDRNVCYVGGVTKIRGIIELVNSLDYVDCMLILAGTFSDKSLEEEVRSLRGWKKVVYKGMVDRKGVYEILASSTAGIVTFLPQPNHINALPNKMFEYMSAGLPLVTSDFPLWKEIVEGNNCGLCVNSKNPQAIASSINYIINNPEEAKLMGLNGIDAVKKKYNWSIEEKKLISIYEKLFTETDN